jgi:hypothetical protein
VLPLFSAAGARISMYYLLETDSRDNVYMEEEAGRNSHISLSRGKLWDIEADKIELPYRYTMKVVEGQTPIFYGWYPGSYLMQQKMADVLLATGVDNLQLFPTEIVRDGTGEAVPGYVAFNIVGRIACAAQEKSKSMPIANLQYFNELTIYPSKTGGQLMFRLKESPMLVLIHETVAKAIDSQNFPGVVLLAIAEAEEP